MVEVFGSDGAAGFWCNEEPEGADHHLEVLSNLPHHQVKDLLALIEIFSGKVQIPPPKLQVCLKHIVDRSTAEKKKMLQMLSDKRAK